MTKKELINIMSRPMSTELIPKYKEIYKIATNRPWEGCLCSGGYRRLYKTCLNFYNDPDKLIEKLKK